MPKFPYRLLGTLFNRNFRNDLNQNFADIESDIKELGAGQAQALEAASEAETQAVYAQEQGDYANEQGTFASDQGTFAQTQADRASTEADRAASEANRVAQVADENKTKFLPAVATVADRDTAYPTPAHGDTVRVTGEAKIYRYDSVSGWVVTDQYNPAAIDEVNVKLADIAINGKAKGAKGDGVTDDSTALQNVINECITKGKRLYLPNGAYKVNQPLNADGLIGLIGESMAGTVIKAGAAMTTVLSIKDMSRMELESFTVDGGGLANNCIDTSYTAQGPSLNNSYRRILVKNYLQTGWIANNNNDCWFEDCMGIEPFDPATSLGALSANASGGPLQFLNCNFLDDVLVGSQYTSFINCVNKGITVQYVGFNQLKYEGGYLMQGKNNCGIYVPSGLEVGPLTFSASHIELPNGATVIGGSGKVHYGVDLTGVHILNNSPTPTQNKFIADTITSAFSYCLIRFKASRLEYMSTPRTSVSGFPFDYISSYADTVPIANVATITPLNGYSKITGEYGDVHIICKNQRVLVSGTLGVGTKTSGTVIGNIPVGYRPYKTIEKLLCGFDGGGVVYPSAVKVKDNGDIEVFGGFNANLAYLGLELEFDL